MNEDEKYPAASRDMGGRDTDAASGGGDAFGGGAPAAGSDDGGRLSRRTIMAGAAWAVPAVMMASTSPAFAVSSALLTLSTTNMQVPASGTVTVTATLVNSSGTGVGGQSVVFSGPSGSTFSPSATRTTNSSGRATVTFNLNNPWAMPGPTAVVNAVSGSETKSQTFTVVGANLLVAGLGYTSTFAQVERVFPSRVVQAVSTATYIPLSGTYYPSFMVVLQDGTLWTKTATVSSSGTWAKMTTITGVKQIAVGVEQYYGPISMTYALLSDGTVKAWGDNSYGQLGDGTKVDRSGPTTVTGLVGVTQIAAGYNTGYALLSDGSVKAWGRNNSGQVGDGTTTDRVTPTPVTGLGTGVTQVGGGDFSAFALLSNGTVTAWGSNAYGQLGDGTTMSHSVPAVVPGLSGVTQIAVSAGATYALLSNGGVMAWGSGGNGQLGDGQSTTRTSPVSVSTLSSATRIAARYASACALLTNGSVRAWGENAYGQLGDGTNVRQSTPVGTTSLLGQSVTQLTSDVGGLSASSFLITG
ncbi:hypothetical protein [uncultured Microbacterium sp.]|uniref:RCC1 domain-containing protein n=1 Tax=uncultured Microbacterium sp. TaxID=191216 RepID=UPI0028D674F2|nr:hypothetical protein [uncultured Microbacterium sp.]